MNYVIQVLIGFAFGIVAGALVNLGSVGNENRGRNFRIYKRTKRSDHINKNRQRV